MTVHPRGWQAALQAELGVDYAPSTHPSCINLLPSLLLAFAVGAVIGFVLSNACQPRRHRKRVDKATETAADEATSAHVSCTTLPAQSVTNNSITSTEATQHPPHPPELSETHRRMALLVASLGIDTGDLTAGEKVQLLGVTVDLWNAMTSQHQQTAALWLQAQANQLQEQHVHLVDTSTRATLRKHAVKEAAHAQARFRARVDDSLCTGLVVMLALLLIVGLRLGTLHAGLQACQANQPWAPLRWLPSLWWGAAIAPVLHAVAVGMCCIRTLGAGAAGVVVMAGFGLLLMRWRMLQSLQQRPVVSVGILVGVFGGAAGAWGVQQLGGLAGVWLPLWVMFVAVHLVGLLSSAVLERWMRGWRVALAMVVCAVVLPTVAALVPFWPWWPLLVWN